MLFTLIQTSCAISAQQITTEGKPAQLDIRIAGEHSLRITLKPVNFKDDFPYNPAIAERNYSSPAISLREINKTIRKKLGTLHVEVRPDPLTIVVTNTKGEMVQELVFHNDGVLSFRLNDQPVLGMGEGGPRPQRGTNWRNQPIQFDHRGKIDSMQPRWQSDAYGSRNPVAMLIGTEGWGLFVASPWVHVDLEKKGEG